MTALATSEPPPDAVLAAAYQRGDERAAAEIVRRHAAAVARFLYSSGAPSAELDDLMQGHVLPGLPGARHVARSGLDAQLALRHRREPAPGRAPEGQRTTAAFAERS